MIQPTILDRSPPHSLEAERGVLGSLFIDPRVADDVALAVRPAEFYSPSYRRFYEELLAMHNAGKPIDVLLLAERLKARGDLEAVGGSNLLLEIAQEFPTAANATHYAGIVRDKAVVRDLIHASSEILRDAYDQTAEPRELIGQAEARIFAVADNRTAAVDSRPVGDILTASMAALKSHKLGEFQGVATGFPDLDVRLGGLRPGTLTILAARPSMGKSAFAANIAVNVAFGYAKTVLFISLEMSDLEIGDRILSAHSGVPLSDMRNVPTAAQSEKLVAAMSELSKSKLLIDDSSSLSMTEIAAKCRRNKRKHGLDLVVIDYLQLIDPDDKRRPREEQVSAISRRLKTLARELKVPIMCLAQLNRKTEDATNQRPRLSHLRESGAIEQDADVVLFIHRDEYYATTDSEREATAGKALIITAKARQAQIGEDPLTWRAETCQFRGAVRDAWNKPSIQYVAPKMATGKVAAVGTDGPWDFGQSDNP